MEPLTTGVFDDITDVPGVRVGHARNLEAKTGVTVVLPPPRRVSAGVHIGGFASSTRQIDSLSASHVVDGIHGVCLCGGSAFGLDAVGGALAYLEEIGVGIPVTGKTIPIVPSAALFDLNFGLGTVRPDKAMGYEAAGNAAEGPIDQGSVGAGTGATIGKLKGIEHAVKGGLGSASVKCGPLVVGAIVAVNCYGDVRDETGRLIAGVRTAPDSGQFADAVRLLEEGKAATPTVTPENTTLAVVAANARFDKIGAGRIAAQATLGLARHISPFHAHIDGDVTMALSVGDLEADPNRIGLLAAAALRRAIVKAVRQADGFGLLPSWTDLRDGTTSASRAAR